MQRHCTSDARPPMYGRLSFRRWLLQPRLGQRVAARPGELAVGEACLRVSATETRAAVPSPSWSCSAAVPSSSNRPLEAEAAEGRFRRDVLYCLHVVGVSALPLRERAAAGVPRTDHYWKTSPARRGAARGPSGRDGGPLCGRRLPCNVRERQGADDPADGSAAVDGCRVGVDAGRQVKLLGVFQDGEVRRVGENRTQRLDLRIVAATDRPLDAEAAEGRFRKDLLYRLHAVGPTAAAPGAPAGRRPPRRALLERRRRGGLTAARPWRARRWPPWPGTSWPGNVRELQNVLANLAVTGPRYGPVGPGALPAAFRTATAAEWQPRLAEAREHLERAMVRDALGRHGSVARAAGDLGVTRRGPLDSDSPAPDRPLQPGCDRPRRGPSGPG